MAASNDNKETENSSTELSVRGIKKRIIKNFLDILILIELKHQTKLSGYDLALFERNKFGIALSPGTIYAALYSLERKGFIKGEFDGKKTTFLLTPKGEEALVTFRKSGGELTDFIRSLFTLR